MSVHAKLQVYFPSAIFKLLLTKNRKPDQAHFMVPLHFNKIDIKEYLSKLYNVECTKVNTLIMQIKDPSTKNKKKRYKKAIVTLNESVELPVWEKDWKQLDLQAYRLRSYIENYKHPSRMFMPHKGKTKYILREIEKIEKTSLTPLLKHTDNA